MAVSAVDSPGNYAVPTLPVLLSTASFLYLLRVAEHISDVVTNAHLLGSLLLGIFWASPHVGNLLSPAILSTFTLLGYIGLLILIFAAGLTTPLILLLNPSNLLLSMLAGATGIALPFAFTFALLHGAYGYTILQAFGAGAALCSTSLGTTIALLNDEMRKKRVGVVLITAALADDVVGLVIAGIVANLGSNEEGSIHWSTIVRPILVSLAFTFGTPIMAIFCRWTLHPPGKFYVQVQTFCRMKPGHVHLFVMVTVLTAFVAGSHYAGTSELYGAYLAGTFLSYVFEPVNVEKDEDTVSDSPAPIIENPILVAFTRNIEPLLNNLFSPLFFASIGASLPVQNLFTITTTGPDGLSVSSHDVVWKGIVYSVLMVIAKAGTGAWMLVWPDNLNAEEGPALSNFKRRLPAALFLGLAMVARGEIALIVAQLARPLLTSNGQGTKSEEPFAVVTWAILLTTFCGAFGVGFLLKRTRSCTFPGDESIVRNSPPVALMR
ncbi:Sodium/hydrogen exchanger [Coprinopsis marcescibilis]|uniref:Sodium/hydrogen exchanger n=1 Tax=Coprinopsis marcescibilis TaxID=230819 RepID=A0A5C3LA26_COPMA|nr:Sodium/hydrogen exchanger [Coprinopsis marcescibilis]